MENRKILVEVTPEEYEKIIAGKLDLSTYPTEELIHELVFNRTPADTRKSKYNEDKFTYARTAYTEGTLDGKTSDSKYKFSFEYVLWF